MRPDPTLQVWARKLLNGDVAVALYNKGADWVTSDCHFRKTATEHNSKPDIKWLSCTAK